MNSLALELIDAKVDDVYEEDNIGGFHLRTCWLVCRF
jgi:hypothetical protein